jgi:hypothetical protein
VDPSRVENVEEEDDGAATDAEFILQSSIIILIYQAASVILKKKKAAASRGAMAITIAFLFAISMVSDRFVVFQIEVDVFRTELFTVFQIQIDFRFVLLE